MKIGMMLPAHYAIGSPFNGVREQAYYQANALENMGHELIRLDAWEKYDLSEFDVVHFFQGGPFMHAIEKTAAKRKYKLIFAPIIDTDMPNWRYRFAALAGQFHPKIKSVQAYYADQGRASDAVVARSEHEKSKLVEGLGVSEEKVQIVLNGCPAPRDVSPELARSKFSLRDDFILHISKYTNANKNVANMIRAIGPTGLKLVIAGTSENNELKSEINEVAKEFENVEFIGRVSDDERDSLYASCRVFCLPSYREGTGLVAVEAASYGAAVVITANGGPPDYFQSYAEYVTTGRVDEIRSSVEAAWGNGNRNSDLKKHVIDNLTWDKSANSLLDIYQSLQ